MAKLGKRDEASPDWVVHVIVGAPSKGFKEKAGNAAAVVRAVSSVALSAGVKAAQSAFWEAATIESEKALVVKPVATAHLQVFPTLLWRAERTAAYVPLHAVHLPAAEVAAPQMLKPNEVQKQFVSAVQVVAEVPEQAPAFGVSVQPSGTHAQLFILAASRQVAFELKLVQVEAHLEQVFPSVKEVPAAQAPPAQVAAVVSQAAPLR